MANKKELIEAAQALGLETEGLTVAQLKESITAAEANDATASEGDDSTDTTKLSDKEAKKAAEELKKHQTKTEGVFKDGNGVKYRFKKTAPKTLNIDGVPRSTKHLIEDKAIMLELISGNNNFVERIN